MECNLKLTNIVLKVMCWMMEFLLKYNKSINIKTDKTLSNVIIVKCLFNNMWIILYILPLENSK